MENGNRLYNIKYLNLNYGYALYSVYYLVFNLMIMRNIHRDFSGFILTLFSYLFSPKLLSL